MARMGHDSERAALLGSRLGSPDTVPRTQDGSHGRAGRVREPPSLAADDAFRQDDQDRVSCGCPMILAASVRARRGGETNAWI